MTDKKTDSGDFALNHLDETSDETSDETNSDIHHTVPGIPERREPTVATHDASMLNDVDETKTNSIDPTKIIDPNPINHTEIAPPEHEKTVVGSDRPEPAVKAGINSVHQPVNNMDKLPSRQHLPTILAIFAILLSVLALASNRGKSNHGNSAPDINTNARIQILEQRLSAQEQLSMQQKQSFESQLSQLQNQVTSLASLATTSQRTHAQPTSIIKPDTIKSASTSHSSKKNIVAAAVSSHHGGWVINIASMNSRSAAAKEQSRLKARGIRTTISEASIRGKTWYRLHTSGFSSKAKAAAYKKALTAKYGIKNAWIQKL